MQKSEFFWVRWITLLILALIIGFNLHTFALWNFWFSGITAVFMAVILISAIDISFRFFLKREVDTNKNNEEGNPDKHLYKFTRITIESLQTLLEVHSEKEILEIALQSGINLLGVGGASFLPYDEWGQSLPALLAGKVPGSALQSWTQRLSLPETRQICKNCEALHGSSNCVLLASTGTALATQVRCFPLISAKREVGVLNFYHYDDLVFNTDAIEYFVHILAAAGQALENLHSRDQEISALHYLQTISSPKSDLSELLNSLVENVQHALDVDFAMLYLPGGIPGQINSDPELFVRTKIVPNPSDSIPDISFLEGIWKSVITSGHSISLENVLINKREKWKTLFAVPLVWRGEETAGVLLLGSNNAQALTQRHQALLETMAGQAAMLIQNARLMVQVEYQAVVDERTRLAREIHDGLAQTLAFLKIQAAQMQNFLSKGETEKLTNTLDANYRTLSDAYIDARQAIDNLRRVPTTNLGDWINQVATDFEQTTNLKVNLSVVEFSQEYPVNIQAQLIRIVQEALSNIRKHAQANRVSIIGFQDGDVYVIEIRDDGCGFTPLSGTADGKSHYGLRGMRERSESIGADFQITSQPGQGTNVSIRVPYLLKENL